MNDESPKMRPSRVLRKLRAGGVAICAKLNLADPRVSEMAARSGFDCVWVDMEHVPSTLQQIENHVRAAKIYDVDTVVRVQRGSYSDLIHPLEMDAAGIMVPHCMGVEDAEKVAWYTRFHPIGRRPLDGGNADGAYNTIPADEYIRQANEQRFVIVQIEDPEPLDELEQIAGVDGIDMILFGAADFSHAIGAVGQWDHPKIREVRRRIPEVARSCGKFAGALGPPAQVPEMVDLGYQFISVCADVVILATAFGDVISELSGTVAGPPGRGDGNPQT